MITQSGLSGSLMSLLYSSMYSFNLFLIISVLYCAHLCMKCSLGLSHFLEEISSLSHSVVFLYVFTLITEEGFLISPCYSLERCIQMLVSFLFSFAFHSLLFTAICKASPDSHFAFSISFPWGWSQCAPPEKGMANHFSYLALRTP